MSFLADLLTDLLISLGVSSTVSSKRKLPYFIIGGISIIVSGLSLLLCLYLLKPVPIENYYMASITYTYCYGTGPKDDRSILLGNLDKKYLLSHYLWPKGYSESKIVDLLSQSEQATIWLASKDDLKLDTVKLKGLSTKSFTVEPSIGWKKDKFTQRLWFGLAGMFFVLGIVIIVAVWFDKSYA